MSNTPYNASHLKYPYRASLASGDRPLRPAIDNGLFHHGEIGDTLAVINEVANQLGIDAPRWCHFMEEALRRELHDFRNREEVLCGLHELVAEQFHQEDSGPQLHR